MEGGAPPNAGALVAYNMQQQLQPAMQPMHMGRRHQHLTQYRPLPGQLRQYLDALGGPSDRAPLVYTGDPSASLDRLHDDVVSHYRQLSAVLGEPERHDLMNHASPLSGMSFGSLSLAGPSAPLLLGPPGGPSSSYASSGLALPSSSFLGHSPGAPAAPGAGLLGPGGSIFPQLQRSYPSAVTAGGLRPSLASAPAALQLGSGVRASAFAVLSPQPRDGSSLMTHEASQLLYPPVGSTFEGGPSRSVEAARRAGGGIDAMSDLRYRRAAPLQYDDLVRDLYPHAGGGGAPGAQSGGWAGAGAGLPPVEKFRSGRSEQDQLDSFLSDFVAGKAQAALPVSAVSLSSARAYKPQHIYST